MALLALVSFLLLNIVAAVCLFSINLSETRRDFRLGLTWEGFGGVWICVLCSCYIAYCVSLAVHAQAIVEVLK